MKIKSIVFLLVALVTFGYAVAQDDVDCKRQLQHYGQKAKAEEYEEALPYYEKLVEHCPSDYHAAVYQYGNRMFKHLMENEEDDAKKKEYAQQYIDNYRLLEENFPDKVKGNIDTKLAQLAQEYDLGSKQEQYDAFDKIWAKDKENFTDPKALYTYFSLLIDLHDDGEKELDDVFIKYDEILGKINEEEAMRAEAQEKLREKEDDDEELTTDEKKEKKNNDLYLRNYMRIKESVDKVIGDRADCENLIPLYEKNFDEHKDDADWLKLAATRLSKKKCTDGDLFFDITVALHDVEPSAKSAKYLGQLAKHKGNTSEAVQYYEQSLDLEDNKLDKASIYYRLANIYNDQGQNSKAKDYYENAVNSDPSYGVAYLKIAEMISSSANDCGESVFDKQATQWLAEEYANRAAQADPSLKKAADDAADAYSQRAPSKSDIFKEGKQGETITIGCWINESVTVPNL